MDHSELNNLLVRVSLADRQAFQRLYHYSSGKLYAIALRVTRDTKIAEDVLQESFISIWSNAHRFDQQKSQAITWMGTIVRNKSIDAMRKHQRYADDEQFEEDTIYSVDENNSTVGELLHGVEHDILHQCLQSLDDKYRDAILLAYLDGYTHKEIATKQQLSVSNVKNRIHRGIAMVKKCVERKIR